MSYGVRVVQFLLPILVLGSSGGYSVIISMTNVGHVQAVRWWQAAGPEWMRQVS